MNFLKYKDNIINLERITHIYKNEVLCEGMPTGVVTVYKVVLAGDGQKVEIKCNSREDADKNFNELWEIIKRCSRWYCS